MIDGIIGKKIGMVQLFRDNGAVQAITVIEAGPCIVTQVKSRDKEGYDAVQLGFGQAKKLNSPETGHLKKLGNLKYLREFPATDIQSIQVGQKVDVGLFQAGEVVDVIGVSKGKGFAGVVKRHHFRGGPKTHGQSDRHRAPGAVGSTTTPGRVLKGLRMAGHMGNRRVTVHNIEVVQADPGRNLLLVKGAVPGSRNSLLLIRKARKEK